MRAPLVTYFLVGITAHSGALPTQHIIPTDPSPVVTFGNSSTGTIAVTMATGALSWTLPVGEVPGIFPISIILKFRASIVSSYDFTTGIPETKSSHNLARHIGASLCFGYLAPAGEKEGMQHLENGTSFSDKDWKTCVKDHVLPASFGLKAPSDTYLTVPGRTHGFYDIGLEDLGNWAPRVSERSSQTKFKVLMDCDRARVYGFHEDLGVHVPILWVDRFGHWVGFRWQKNAENGQVSATILNCDGKGVVVKWAAVTSAPGPIHVLRADFIGFPAPSLLVQGHQDPPEASPAKPLNKSWFSFLPTKILLGASSALPSPGIPCVSGRAA